MATPDTGKWDSADWDAGLWDCVPVQPTTATETTLTASGIVIGTATLPLINESALTGTGVVIGTAQLPSNPADAIVACAFEEEGRIRNYSSPSSSSDTSSGKESATTKTMSSPSANVVVADQPEASC